MAPASGPSAVAAPTCPSGRPAKILSSTSAKALRVAVWTAAGLAAVLVVVLVTTGIWLWSGYRPTAIEWSAPLNRARFMHRWASNLLVWDALVLIPLVLARAAVRRQWPAAVWLLVAAVVIGFSGSLLPWDQLALWQVTVGSDIRGLNEAWGQDVRFVLLGGVEVAPDTYRRLAVTHVVVLPAIGLLVPAIVTVVRSRRRALVTPDTDGG